MTVAPLEPTAAFAELGRVKLGDIDIDSLLRKIADLARRTVPGAAQVSVTLVRGRRAQTAARTGDLAVDLDRWQYDHGAGPCLDAAAVPATFSVPDMTDEHRWPGFAAHAAGRGVLSSLSVGLPVREETTGALNVYALRPGAFDDGAITLAQTFSGYAAVALANVHLYDATAALARQMQAAMESRAVIEQAKGIIIGERRCTPDEAFAVLTALSQSSNRKVRDVAAALVDRAAGH